MLSRFQWYRQWRGGRWAKVTGWMWGKRWVYVPATCVERVDEDYGYPHKHDWGLWTVASEKNIVRAGTEDRVGIVLFQTRTCQTCGYIEVDCQRKTPAL